MTAARTRWIKAFNRGDLAAVDALFSPTLLTHYSDTLLRAPPPGIPGLKQFLSFLRTAFPDLTFTVQSASGQGKTHVYTWAARGTHRGPFMRVRATGKRVAFPGRFMMRHDDEGRVGELWARTSLIGLVSQLGMAPRMSL
jgi:predicted ester cyclase